MYFCDGVFMVVGVVRFCFEENWCDHAQQDPRLFLREARQHILQGLNGGLVLLRLDSDCLELGWEVLGEVRIELSHDCCPSLPSQLEWNSRTQLTTLTDCVALSAPTNSLEILLCNLQVTGSQTMIMQNIFLFKILTSNYIKQSRPDQQDNMEQ